MHHQLERKQISDSQAFRSTQESNVIHMTIFCCTAGNWGCKAKKWGHSCSPAPT